MDRYDLSGRRAALILCGGGRPGSEYDVERIKELCKQNKFPEFSYSVKCKTKEVSHMYSSQYSQLTICLSMLSTRVLFSNVQSQCLCPFTYTCVRKVEVLSKDFVSTFP